MLGDELQSPQDGKLLWHRDPRATAVAQLGEDFDQEIAQGQNVGTAEGRMVDPAAERDQHDLLQIISMVQEWEGKPEITPQFDPPRVGDVKHSLADISKAKTLLGYEPTHRIGEGLAEAMEWYVQDLAD